MLVVWLCFAGLELVGRLGGVTWCGGCSAVGLGYGAV